MSNNTYSYHMFMFPFTWNGNAKKHMNSEEFVKIFDNNNEKNYWERDKEHSDYLKSGINFDSKDKLSYYGTYQFFNEAGKSVIFDKETNDIVSSFKIKDSYLYSNNTKNAQYVINIKNKRISLDIIHIGLKIFNTGIAVFYMNCENNQHRTIADVK